MKSIKFADTKDIIYIFITFIIMLSIILAVMYLQKNNFMYNDDQAFGFATADTIFSAVYNAPGGGFLSHFCNCFFGSVLPVELGIHPGDFAGSHQAVINGIITSIAFISSALFSVFYKKSKIIFISALLFISVFSFYFIIQPENITLFLLHNNFYRYILILIFFNYLILKNSQNILYVKKNSVKKIVLLSILSFICGTCVENIIVTVFTFYTILIIYNCITKLILRNKPEIIVKQYTYKLNFNFYIPFIVFIISVIFYVFSPGCKEIAQARNIDLYSLEKFLEIKSIFSINLIFEFMQKFIDLYIIKIQAYWVTIAIFIITGIKLTNKVSDIKKIILPLIILISILMGILALYLTGKTMGGCFWIESEKIVTYFKITIMAPLYMYISYTIKKIKNKRYKIIISLIFIVLSIITAAKINIKDADEYRISAGHNRKMLGEYKEYIYESEKIIRYYYLKNETAKIRPYNKMGYVIFSKEFSGEFPAYYFDIIYRDMSGNKIKLPEFNENAIELFYKAGGSFQENEIKEHKFTNLLDNNFVLNNK